MNNFEKIRRVFISARSILPANSVTIKSGVLQLLPMKEQILHCLEVSGFYHRRY